MSLAEASKNSYFVIYIMVISSMKDIRRVFEYHGAELKQFTASNMMKVNAGKCKNTQLFTRCSAQLYDGGYGCKYSTVFLYGLAWNSSTNSVKNSYLPLVSGISYEFIRLAGKSNSPFIRVLNTPGMWLQKLTTREPDKSQLEVAIAALKSVLN